MGLTYKKAGVNIEQADLFLDSVKATIAKSARREVMGSFGGFGAFFDLSKVNLKRSVLVSSCDGVGTKLKVAVESGIHQTVGIDLVAMSVNDVLCSGAEPLFFLDYIATGRIQPSVLKEVVTGIAKGCRQAGCALVGGETAEMPGMYKKDEYDLAGFCVGAVEKKSILGRSRVALGDVVIGLASSGLHSNGFSLVRKVFTREEIKGRALEFLEPTRIYTKPVLNLLTQFNKKKFLIKAIAHITGGGFYNKAARLVPSHMSMILYRNAWPSQAIFEEIQRRGRVKEQEMLGTFNMGIGMVLVVHHDAKMDVMRRLKKLGLRSYIIGDIVSGVGGVEVV